MAQDNRPLVVESIIEIASIDWDLFNKYVQLPTLPIYGMEGNKIFFEIKPTTVYSTFQKRGEQVGIYGWDIIKFFERLKDLILEKSFDQRINGFQYPLVCITVDKMVLPNPILCLTLNHDTFLESATDDDVLYDPVIEFSHQAISGRVVLNGTIVYGRMKKD